MLRLAHRLLSQPIYVLNGPADGWRMLNHDEKVFRNQIAESESFIADDIAEFYLAHEKQEWDFDNDFGPICPPCEKFIVEWILPPPEKVNIKAPRQFEINDYNRNRFPKAKGQIVVCVEPERLQQLGCSGPITKHILNYKNKHPSCRWVFVVHQALVLGDGTACILSGLKLVVISDVGRILECGHMYFSKSDVPFMNGDQPAPAGLHEMLLTLDFMSCPKVAVTDATEKEGPSRKWMKRQGLPEIRYHTLNITPMKELLRTVGGIEQNTFQKAMHLCRGHWAHYTADKPLFGKFTGTFWKPAHVRGSVEQGIVDKDYRIKIPEAAPA